MSGQTINVISAPNASDADAATYAIDASTVASRIDLDPNYPDSFVFSDGVIKITGIDPKVVTNFTYRYHELDIDGRGGTGGKLLAISFYVYRRAMIDGSTRNRGCFPAHVR